VHVVVRPVLGAFAISQICPSSLASTVVSSSLSYQIDVIFDSSPPLCLLFLLLLDDTRLFVISKNQTSGRRETIKVAPKWDEGQESGRALAKGNNINASRCHYKPFDARYGLRHLVY
jgi:hypothetical protein